MKLNAGGAQAHQMKSMISLRTFVQQGPETKYSFR